MDEQSLYHTSPVVITLPCIPSRYHSTIHPQSLSLYHTSPVVITLPYIPSRYHSTIHPQSLSLYHTSPVVITLPYTPSRYHSTIHPQSLFKGLRLVMWSLLHDTDQLREMLSTDQSLRDRRSRGLWSVLNISRG